MTDQTREALRAWLVRLAESLDQNEVTADLYMQEIEGARTWAALLREAEGTIRNVEKDDYWNATEAEGTPPFDFLAHLARQREWSERTFGPGARTAGVVDHIRKELCEIEADPTDISEWIDVVILGLDGAWRAGFEPQQIIDAIVAKQAKNEARTWPDWRTAAPDKAIEHVRAEGTPQENNEKRIEQLTQDNLGNKLLDACSSPARAGRVDHLPACPDSPGRLWSLWDVMNQFKVGELSSVVGQIGIYEMSFAQSASQRAIVAPQIILEFMQQLRGGVVCLQRGGLPDSAQFLAKIHDYIAKTQDFDPATLNSEARHAREAITDALTKRQFLRVADDRRDYVDGDELFGRAVYDAFPSARDDVKAAGNCLSAECPTAAVFHLMRVAEIGLRALAYDRDVHVFKNAKTMFEIPLELASWDQLIRELEAAEKEIQSYPQTRAREDQFDFYHGAMMQYRAFKNKFRNSIMHSRDSYDRDEAFSAYNKVKEFMEILARKIGENTRTPAIWGYWSNFNLDNLLARARWHGVC